MALSLDDRILGEKTQYYCSSSEGEEEENEPEGNEHQKSSKVTAKASTSDVQFGFDSYSGRSVNTGPKGVVEDWRRFKQFEVEKREEQERERHELAKKLSLTCRSYLDDEREKANDDAFMQMLEEQFDEVAEQYRKNRLEELRTAFSMQLQFGKVFELNDGNQFLEAIDSAPATLTVIIHAYENSVGACRSMNRCLESLASRYPVIKFCRIRASAARLSVNFTVNGLPTLLVYKNGELIGNFVRLVDEFGDDIHSSDVESFLVEHGMLPDRRSVLQPIIRTAATIGKDANETDSD